MNIKEAKEQIKYTVTAYLTKDDLGRYVIPPSKQRPIFLMGPPGIGKTAIMEQVASELGIGLLSYSMTHHTRQSALGLPLIKHVNYFGNEYDISEYTMSEIISSIYEMMQSTDTKNGILFLDEINCVSETLAPIMLQFLQYKVFGRHEVPEGWIVVTAGNPPEYNHSVREFDIVTWDRLKRVDVEPDFDTWKEFAYLSGVHASVLTYLEIKKGNFYKVETTVDGKSFVTARGWDDLSQMIQLYEMHNIPVNRKLISQYIQNEKIAQDFSIYYDLYNKYKSDYQINDILSGNVSEDIKNRAKKAKFDERFSLIGLMLDSVMTDMKASIDMEDMLSELLVTLKRFKKEVKTFETSLKLMNDYVTEYQKIYHNCLKSKSISEVKQKIILMVIQILKEEIKLIQMDTSGNPFSIVKKDFDERVKAFHCNVENTSSKVKNMFVFCDEAFQNGQELIILVTELTANPNSARFLGKYKVDEYFKYAKELMIHQRYIEINREIAELALP